MSRSRKDDSRYQSPAGPGLQSSPSLDAHSTGVGAFHSPGVSGHNYVRSKVKDKDRSGYVSKDRGVRSANAADANERYFAQHRQGNFQSPPPNSYQCSDGASSSRELSWADEVELSMSNNILQRTDANNAAAGGTPQKPTKSLDHGQMTKSLEHGQLMKSQEHGAVESKSAMQSGDANQRPVEEKAQKLLPKNTAVQPAASFSNGKAKVNFDKEHEQASFKRANCPQLRRGSRKKTLSLNPEEREALESLIEEVLMDGVIDSESASSEEETEHSETWKNAEQGGAGGNAGAGGDGLQKARGDKGKMGRKYYPGQLKVALKHMTELPPRFSRKLKKAEKYLELNTMRVANSTTGRIEEEDEESVALAREEKRMSLSPRPPERDKEKAKSKEHQVKEFKRSIRTLLTDLDQYVDEKSVLSNSTSIHPPGAIICEDLERESLSIRPLPQGPDPTHEVPSTVQNLLLAAKGYTSVASNQAGAAQDIYQEQYEENESAPSGSNLGGYPGPELGSQRGYAGPYTVPYSTAGSQFMVNVPEFVPKGMMVTAYQQQQEMLSPPEHHHQYPASLMTQLSPGSMSGNLNDPNSRHGMTTEQMMAMGQGCSLANASSASTESMSSGMMDFSNSMASLPPALGTPQGSSMGENMLSPMPPPVFVSSGMPLSNLPSPGGLPPFYQFQTQNPPPPSSSYSFPVQVPFSSNQYCYMPPALPPQSLPPPYYPRDQQVHYADGGLQFKTMVPDWGYQKPKHYSSNVSTLPTYSAFSNQITGPPSYPGSEQAMPGMNNPNFRQRKKQPGSSLSPRNAAVASSNMSGGKFAMQRTRGNEVSTALTRVGLRPGQENAEFYPHQETSMTVPAYGDASTKRFPFTVRSRVSGDGQSGYPGRRENRNFVSEKYAIPRTFPGDGKKEARHVTLKPKQSKPNRSLARPRNDPNVAQLHPLKAHHPSDLSEEGLESPDNFGDVESGADDWSTDNYDQEVSKRGKEDAVDLRDPSNGKEEVVVPSTVLPCPVEEVRAMQPVEMTPDDICISENGLAVVSPVCVAETPSAEIAFQVDDVVPMCSPEPAVGEPAKDACETGSTADVVEHLSIEVHLEESCVAVAVENSRPQLEVDRQVLQTENLKRTAVWKKFQALLEDLQVVYDVPSVPPGSPTGRMLEPVAERECPSVGDCSGDNNVCESHPELSFVVGSEQVTELPVDGLVDIDVPDVAVDEEDVCRSASKGMDVMLGMNFISRLMNMFKQSQSSDSPCEHLPKTQVHLSEAVLNQIYLEYVMQDQSPHNLQNVLSESLEEDVSNEPAVDLPPERRIHVTISPSIDERTLTRCSIQQQQLCDTSCHRDSDSNDVVLHNNGVGNLSEDVVLPDNSVSSLSEDVVLHDNSVSSLSEDVVLHYNCISSLSEDVVLHDNSICSVSEDVVLHDNRVSSPSEDVVLPDNSVSSLSEDVVLPENSVSSLSEDVVLHDNSVSSPSEDVVLHDNCVSSPSEDVVLHDNCVSSLSEDVVLHDNSIGSMSEDVVLPDNSVSSLSEDVVLHDNGVSSLSEDVVLHDNCVSSPSEDVALPDNSVSSLSEDVVLHDNSIGSVSEDVVLHDNRVSSPSEDVVLPDNSVSSLSEDVVLPENSVSSLSEDVVLHDNSVSSPSEDVVLHDNCVSSSSEDVVLPDNSVSSLSEDVVLHNNCVSSPSEDVVLPDNSVSSLSEDVVLHDNCVSSLSEDVVLHDNCVSSPSEDVALPDNSVSSLSEDVVLHDNDASSLSEDVVLHDSCVGSPTTSADDP